MTKKTVEMARLRQTCCLGLPSRVVMPQILEDMHQIVMSDRMHFAWSDQRGNVINGYYEKPDAVALDYFQHNHERYQTEFGLTYRQTLLIGKPTGNLRSPFRAGFELTESYQRLYRALGLEHTLDGIVRNRSEPLGMICLLRRKGDPDFSAEDEENLAQTLPYIAHAISHEVKTPASFVESGDAGLMVFDPAGELKYQSLKAKELCPYLLAENLTDGWHDGFNTHEMLIAQQALFDRVKHNFAARKLPVDPPAWTVANKWGEFQLQAYALRDSHDEPCSYGVILKKKVPVEVRLLQRVQEMPLSNKQCEVCFMLARGVETAEIATLLGITQTTLKDHIQTIYRKLGIRKREELLRLVLS